MLARKLQGNWTLAFAVAVLWSCAASPTRAPAPTRLGDTSRSTSAAPPQSSNGPDAASARPAAVVRAVLRVGTSGDYAPFSIRDAAGRATGFDIDIAEGIARDLGFELRFVPFRWPELSNRLTAGDFDVAMSGVTWQPTRAVSGYMTRAVGRGGPCVLGSEAARRVAVNRGGVLEKWAGSRFGDRDLVRVDDNRSLPELLAAGSVGAIVTDSFERAAFQRPGWAVRCDPPHAQKVYWIGPAAVSPAGTPGASSDGAARLARELGPRIDAWLRANGAFVQESQERWFSERHRLDSAAHLVDLLARRMAFMPLVAASKAEKKLPLEDPVREREVLAAVGAGARRKGLREQPTTALFALQIELSKAVQRRLAEPSSLDLATQIRPALNELGERILDALAEARADELLTKLTAEDLQPLSPWLSPPERLRLLGALRAIGG